MDWKPLGQELADYPSTPALVSTRISGAAVENEVGQAAQARRIFFDWPKRRASLFVNIMCKLSSGFKNVERWIGCFSLKRGPSLRLTQRFRCCGHIPKAVRYLN